MKRMMTLNLRRLLGLVILAAFAAALASTEEKVSGQKVGTTPPVRPLDPVWVCYDANDPPDTFPDMGGIFFNLAGRWPGNQGDPVALTWSLMPDGVMIPQSGFDEPAQGALASNLFARFNTQFPNQATWVNAIQACFDRWEQLTGIDFTRVTSGGNAWDDGAVFGTAGDGVNRGDIRIGGRCIDGTGGVDCTGGMPTPGNILAYNQFPANGGDMVVDTADNFNTGGTNLFLRNTLMHEIGHGIGLQHVCPTNQTKMMEPTISTAYDGPRHDDIRGAQVHYGDPFEADNASGAATNLGGLTPSNPADTSDDIPAPAVPFGSVHSIDADGESDFFEFSVSGAELLDVTLTPVGLTYDSSTQNGDGTCNSGNNVNSLAVADLAFEIRDSDGTTVLLTRDSTGAGSAETATDFALNAGTYFIRVFEANAPTQSQLYNLLLDINQPPVAMCQPFTDNGDDDCCITVTVADINDGSFDPNGAGDIDTICITAVDGTPVACLQSVEVCDDGTFSSHTVTLQITDLSGESDSCDATVTVNDNTPPDIICPPNAIVTCGDPTDPAALGSATATDNCDPNPVISHTDVVVQATCPADPINFTIQRTWRATDDSTNQSSCLQTITVLKRVAKLDIKPGSCPNSYNRAETGVLPVGLLGTADFDVTEVIKSTVRISRGDCVGGTVKPLEGPQQPHTVLADVGTPFLGMLCDCHQLTGDGVMDLSMKFSRNKLKNQLQLSNLSVGQTIEIVVTGVLTDGCKFVARDCIRIVH